MPLTELGDVQIPILASMLLGACAAKLLRVVQGRSVGAGLGPTALFPLRLRRSAAVVLCGVEFAFGVGLILTSGRFLRGQPAELTRLCTGLLFVLATCALIELRSVRPDIGCGCFGDFSSAPITGRTLARSALLAVAALATVRLPPIQLPRTFGQAALLLFLFAAELAVFGAISPEVAGLLVRIGYSAPCELAVLSQEQTLAILRRSAQWRRHNGLIADPQPTDMWRELCWRYVAFPSRSAGADAQLVFALYLHHRRPMVLSALVDTATGAALPWPAADQPQPRVIRPGPPGALRLPALRLPALRRPPPRRRPYLPRLARPRLWSAPGEPCKAPLPEPHPPTEPHARPEPHPPPEPQAPPEQRGKQGGDSRAYQVADL